MSNEISKLEKTIQTIAQTQDDDQVAVFDPRVKYLTKKEEQAAAIVWSTKSIELAYQAIEEGKGLRISPFHKNNPNLRKANLVFQYTEEEIMEILRCKKDILYFAEKYVLLKTEEGLKNIKLRPYQKKLLKSYQENRWNITLMPRQAGKCVTGSTEIRVRFKNGVTRTLTMRELYDIALPKRTIKQRFISYLIRQYHKLNA